MSIGSRSEKRLPGWVMAGAVACLLAVTGCETTVKYGVPFRTDKLSELTPGVSTKAEVRDVLGAPRGDGLARFTADPRDRWNMWLYEYMETTVGAGADAPIGHKQLLVFFKGDVYDGVVWWSASHLLEVTPAR